jgi:HPt (histidine-containing phosphotransfer) domain-containing protein
LLSEADIDATSRDAHAIVSAAGNLGLDRLSAQARLLEHACRKGELQFIGSLIGEVKVTAIATEAEIKAWLSAAALKQKAIA